MRPGLTPSLTPAASVSPTSGGGHLLKIPAGPSGRYRLAQLEDYSGLARAKFPAHPPRTLSLRARVSAGFCAGTWGFGFWNDPYGPTLNPPRVLPALPNAAWFFHASPHNYLSFREDKPAHGFLAQTFRAPGFHPLLVPAALTLPFARQTTRRLLSRIIDEDGIALSVDPAQWHAYRLRWGQKRVIFEVDEVVVLETSVSPNPPLGLVIWIDNQYAAFTPQGKIAWGFLNCDEAAWLEIENLELNT